MNDENFKLCYVDGDWAFFTTCPLKDQWGDDWNDAPYEHNAGYPYSWTDRDGERGIEKYEIKRVAFSASFEKPCDRWTNSPYSVQIINEGATPWLMDNYESPPIHIFAGTSLPEFIRLVQKCGGHVYTKVGEN